MTTVDDRPIDDPPIEASATSDRGAGPVSSLEGDRGADTADAANNQPFVPLGTRLRQGAATRWERTVADPGRAAEAVVSIVAVALATALVFGVLHPTALFSNTTPTGGDMGSHVWGPRYLLDHLLPHFRLSGWTPDWYDGFPAYQFYMVVPSLLIVAIHVGLTWYFAIPAVLLLIGVGLAGWLVPRLYPYRRVLAGFAAAATVLVVPYSYNRSFKLVTALGLLFLPLACWAFAKLADLPFPIPPIAAAASLLFIFNQQPLYENTGNIIGGNFQSTMAGEFAFSISLTLAVLYLGVAARGLRTGKHRALAAVLFALAGLCHLIPAIFVLACTAALFVVRPARARVRWLATMVPVAGLLTAFWVLPFWWRSDYVNDMGWEKLPKVNGDQSSVWYYLFPSGLRWLIIVALAGAVISFLRRHVVGQVLSLAWTGVAFAFAFLPQARLWNARLLPFMYLSVALLAAIALGDLVRLAAAAANGNVDRPLRPITVPAALVALVAILIYSALPIAGMFDSGPLKVTRTAFTDTASNTAKTRSEFLGIFGTTAKNPVSGWSGYNYAGLEEKPPQPLGCDAVGSTTGCSSGGFPEYRRLVQTMAGLGEDKEHGCGRAMWEFNADRLNGYGTTMTPMMFPYFTDGCIGSQEGLYFESSTTVPYHFLMQSELSTAPSQPQRDLVYPAFDLAAGIRHMQLLGVKYYLAVTPSAVSAAATNPDLFEVAVTGPWHVYEVADAATVVPLTYAPVVVDGIGESQKDWLPTMSAWFQDLGQLDVPITDRGPKDWKRVSASPVAQDDRRLVIWARQQLGQTGAIDQVPALPRTKLAANKVTNIDMGRDTISFDVAKPGVPVLVKASYFPNWEASGAEGPFRVSPNLMVVIPKSTHVELHYGRTPVDVLAIFLTLLGIAGVVLLARSRPLVMPEPKAGRVGRWMDEVIATPETPLRAERGRRRRRSPETDDDDLDGLDSGLDSDGDGPPIIMPHPGRVEPTAGPRTGPRPTPRRSTSPPPDDDPAVT